MDGVGFREQIRENARRFAAEGYFVVAPDLFYRFGDGITLDMSAFSRLGPDDPERKRLMEVISSVTPQRAEQDIAAIIEAIADDPAADTSRLVTVGYCMGARLALHLAASRDDMVAAAGIHPGSLVNDSPDSPHNELPSVTGRLYFAFAENDRSASPEAVDAFQRAMEEAGVNGSVERLEGTSHGFAMADLPVYDRDASERHYSTTLELWREGLYAPAGA
jgi:carboxymethylenebutenolidase